MLLSAQALAFSYGRRSVLTDVGFSVQPGEWLTIVGPNGAGKTTLLRLLLGLLQPTQGEIRINDRPLSALSRREMARHIALLPQIAELPFGFTVRDVVAMGRTPHLGRFQPMRAADHEAVSAALQATETAELAERPVTELSGGEAQRVFLARAFAQQTPILVLDEPTTNLDLFHERTLLDQVQRRQQQGAAVIAVLHDLNLAARYSDRILLLSAGRVAALGNPTETLTPTLLQQIFRLPLLVQRDPESERLRIWS